VSFFNSKLRYALCAAIDLAMQPSTSACQSREIAARQSIPGPYLDQILAALKGAGLIRSVRGAGGGYNLARSADKINVADIVRAVLRTDRLFSSYSEEQPPDLDTPGVTWIVRDYEEQIESAISQRLNSTTLGDLVRRKVELDDSLSIMPSI
jgi:Rrf2 family protein